MDPLLIVLVIGCALASVTYAARGLHARSRTVERHRQALGTLADITQRPDGPQGWSEEPSDHQAHVRLIGPSGHISPGSGVALPPPRALSSPGAVSPSPFRRPSRTAPSLAAMDAVATSANLGRSPGAQVLRSGQGRPGTLPLPGHEPAEATLPGLPPRLDLSGENGLVEPGLSDEPTRPVPVVQPQVFHFDDLSPAWKGCQGGRRLAPPRQAPPGNSPLRPPPVDHGCRAGSSSGRGGCGGSRDSTRPAVCAKPKPAKVADRGSANPRHGTARPKPQGRPDDHPAGYHDASRNRSVLPCGPGFFQRRHRHLPAQFTFRIHCRHGQRPLLAGSQGEQPARPDRL